EDLVKRHRRTRLRGKALDPDHVVLGNPILFAARAKNCVHEGSHSSSGRRYGAGLRAAQRKWARSRDSTARGLWTICGGFAVSIAFPEIGAVAARGTLV